MEKSGRSVNCVNGSDNRITATIRTNNKQAGCQSSRLEYGIGIKASLCERKSRVCQSGRTVVVASGKGPAIGTGTGTCVVV